MLGQSILACTRSSTTRSSTRTSRERHYLSAAGILGIHTRASQSGNALRVDEVRDGGALMLLRVRDEGGYAFVSYRLEPDVRRGVGYSLSLHRQLGVRVSVTLLD